jgi:leader peptidase (prepilin peptidase)/N-methyltransferase
MAAVPAAVLTAVAMTGLVVGYAVDAAARSETDPGGSMPKPSCTRCGGELPGRAGWPLVGWLAVAGRCSTCERPLVPRQHLVEAGTAALFVAVTLRFGVTAQLPAYLFLTAVAVGFVLADVSARRLSNGVVLLTYLVSALLLMPAGAAEADWRQATRSLAGALAMSAIYFALAVAYPFGTTVVHAKVAGLMGLYLGWLSWQAILVGAVGGLLAGGVSVIVADATGGRHRSIIISFGPPMVLAASGALFVTDPLATWYASLVGGA